MLRAWNRAKNNPFWAKYNLKLNNDKDNKNSLLLKSQKQGPKPKGLTYE